MILRQLLLKYPKEKILKRLVKLYPDQNKNKSGYSKVIDELKQLKPKASQTKIRIRTKSKIVEGVEPSEQCVGLDFTDWREWVSMTIEKETLKNLMPLDIICYCLYEMTFIGFSNKEVIGERNKLSKMLKSIKQKEE